MQAAAMRAHRDTIFVEDATVIHQESWPGEQYLLRLEAPLCAAHAQAGSFAHLQCEPALPMRRPLSIMRVDAEAGWVDFLYKAVGRGTRALAARTAGEIISSLGLSACRLSLIGCGHAPCCSVEESAFRPWCSWLTG
jgi:dihydroorotate dehydrogenase electron transfer subunit